MEQLDRISARIEGLVRVLVIVIMVFMLGTILLDVLARNTQLRVRGLDELARYSLVWLVFLITGVGARYGDLIGMDVFANSLPGRMRVVVWLVRRVLFLGFLALFCWYSLGLVEMMLQTGRNSANLNIPLWFIYSPLALGTLLMFLSLLVDLIVRISRSRRGENMVDPLHTNRGSSLWN